MDIALIVVALLVSGAAISVCLALAVDTYLKSPQKEGIKYFCAIVLVFSVPATLLGAFGWLQIAHTGEGVHMLGQSIAMTTIGPVVTFLAWRVMKGK